MQPSTNPVVVISPPEPQQGSPSIATVNSVLCHPKKPGPGPQALNWSWSIKFMRGRGGGWILYMLASLQCELNKAPYFVSESAGKPFSLQKRCHRKNWSKYVVLHVSTASDKEGNGGAKQYSQRTGANHKLLAHWHVQEMVPTINHCYLDMFKKWKAQCLFPWGKCDFWVELMPGENPQESRGIP